MRPPNSLMPEMNTRPDQTDKLLQLASIVVWTAVVKVQCTTRIADISESLEKDTSSFSTSEACTCPSKPFGKLILRWNLPMSTTMPQSFTPLLTTCTNKSLVGLERASYQ